MTTREEDDDAEADVLRPSFVKFDAPPPEAPDSGGAAEAVEAAAVARSRFCRWCGGVIAPDTIDCAVCNQSSAGATSADAPSLPLVPALVPGAAAPGIKPAMVLYFILLGSFIFGLFGEGVNVVIAIETIDTIIVLIAALMLWPMIRPTLSLRGQAGWVAAGVAMGIGTFFIATVLLELITAFLPIPELSIREEFAGYGLGAMLLMNVIQPGIIEEIAFRGVIFGALLRVLSAGEAIVVSALMFMVLHLNVVAFPHLFIIGLAVGWLRHRSGTLWPCFALHLTHNGLVLASEYLWS